MPKIITIDRCTDCKYCLYFVPTKPTNRPIYRCELSSLREIPDIEDTPEWCELEEVIDAQRCVWTIEEIWYPCLYYTSCGKFMREEFTDDKPFCPFCGKRIEVKEGEHG